jgi:hypothetical protein
MTGKKFNEVQRELELTLSKLKAEIDPERRRALLRKMSRLLASASLAHENCFKWDSFTAAFMATSFR